MYVTVNVNNPEYCGIPTKCKKLCGHQDLFQFLFSLAWVCVFVRVLVLYYVRLASLHSL
jgi:hypothetical protein